MAGTLSLSRQLVVGAAIALTLVASVPAFSEELREHLDSAALRAEQAKEKSKPQLQEAYKRDPEALRESLKSYKAEFETQIKKPTELSGNRGKRIADSCEYLMEKDGHVVPRVTEVDGLPKPHKVKGFSKPICVEQVECRVPILRDGKPYRDITTVSWASCHALAGSCGTAARCVSAPAPVMDVKDELEVPSSGDNRDGTGTRSNEGR